MTVTAVMAATCLTRQQQISKNFFEAVFRRQLDLTVMTDKAFCGGDFCHLIIWQKGSKLDPSFTKMKLISLL